MSEDQPFLPAKDVPAPHLCQCHRPDPLPGRMPPWSQQIARARKRASKQEVDCAEHQRIGEQYDPIGWKDASKAFVEILPDGLAAASVADGCRRDAIAADDKED